MTTFPSASEATTVRRQARRYEDACVHLKDECRAARAAIVAGLNARRDHPTYGVTKASLRSDLARLEGLLYAFWIVTLGVRSANHRMQVDEAARYLDININRLRREVEAS